MLLIKITTAQNIQHQTTGWLVNKELKSMQRETVKSNLGTILILVFAWGNAVSYEKPAMTASLSADIRMWDLPNTKQQY